MIKNYLWKDNPTEANVAVYDSDVINECLMHLKYTNQKLTRFCVNSASVDANGSPNLLTYAGNTVNFNCGNSLVPVMTSNSTTPWSLTASHTINTSVNDIFKSFDADALSYCTLSHCPTEVSPAFISVEKTAAFSFDYLYIKFSSVFNPGDMKNFSVKDALGNTLYSYEATGAFLDKDEFLIPIDNFSSTKFVISTTSNINGVSYVNFPATIKLLDKSQVVALTNAQGASGLLSSVAGVSLATNGTYNLYLGLDGVVEALATTLSVGKVLPTSPVANQVHYLTCSELPQAKKYNASAWVAYDKVPVGKVVVAGGVITSVTTNPYAQNGYDINANSSTTLKFNNQKMAQIGVYTVNGVDYPLLVQYMSTPGFGQNTYNTVTYPIAFPNAAISATYTGAGCSGEAAANGGIYTLTKTYCNMFSPNNNSYNLRIEGY